MAYEDFDFALATEHKADLAQFTREAKNCAALDTGCSSSVAGQNWFEMFKESLDKESKDKVKGPFSSESFQIWKRW